MKRRDLLKAAPLSFAGFLCSHDKANANSRKPLGLEYTEKIRERFETIKHTQSEELLEASYRIVHRIMNGKSCYMNWVMGHRNDYDIWPGRPGNPDILKYGIPQSVKKGDLLLTDCYRRDLEEKHRKGAFLISGPRTWSGNCIGAENLLPEVQKMRLKPFADLWIENYATAYGAIVHIPGEVAPVGAVAGAVGMLTYWMMISDAARILSAHNVRFQVDGDEPVLGSDKVNIDMNRPLGDVYYQAAMEQHSAIDNEFDKINRAANMAVKAALNRGKVYVYSRHVNNLCAEGTVRRGGLSLIFGVSGPPGNLKLMDDPLQIGAMDLTFKPTDKDIVVMGIAKPDDPEDLASLDIFKKAGMPTVAIGPSEKNGKIPGGRTVPSEVDIHIGSMSDTYGLFALPGVDRKIAPTSGFINNQVFWSLNCQIADVIIEKTGNAPGIYLSGAFKGGMERLNEVKRIFRERGY
ncbi:hypothetical protein ACFL60_03080 [Candidatus Omnitrophota bacterium]